MRKLISAHFCSLVCLFCTTQCLRSTSTCQSKQNTSIIWRTEHLTNSVTALKQVFPLQHSVTFTKEPMYSLLELLLCLLPRLKWEIVSRIKAEWELLTFSTPLWCPSAASAGFLVLKILLSDLHSSPVSSLISGVCILKVCNQPASSEGP